MIKYLFKTFVTSQAVAEYDASILRNKQTSSLTTQQYTDDTIAKSCKVVDVYDESTLNDVILKGIDPSIRHSLRNYWATNPQVDLTDMLFQT